MLRLTPRAPAGAAGRPRPQGLSGAGRAPGARRAAAPAASTRCWRPRPTRPPSACSTATASRWSSPPGDACCGSLVHHMGREEQALAQARNNYRRLDARDRRRGARRHPDHGVRLRHHREGLRLHAAQRSGLCREGGARFGARARTSASILRTLDLAPPAQSQPLDRRLSFRLFAAARAEGRRAQPKELLSKARLHRQRCAGRAFVLRLGGHLQHPAAGIWRTGLRDRKVANIETARRRM